MNSTLEFFDPDTGEARTYRRYSARLPEFNGTFGPGTGYRVESEIRALADYQPARLTAITEAVKAGHKPEDVGLGKLGGMMVCTHRLIDSEGRVVSDARAAASVTQYKDLELLETASHQRLMAKVGFGGEIFDDDEDRDIAAVKAERESQATLANGAGEASATESTEPKAAPKAPPKAAPKDMPKDKPKTKPKARTRTESASKAKQRKAPAADRSPAAHDAPTAATEASQTQPPANGSAPSAHDKAAPPAMIRQLKQLAARAGEDPPQVTTFTEAKAQLKRLSKKASGATAP